MSLLSGVLFFVAFLPYIWAIVNQETVPSPVSWAIWASVDTLVLFAMKKEKAPIGQITGAVAGAWIVTTLAIIFGKPTMGGVEWVSVIGALLGIILWKKTGNAVTAIVCSQLASSSGHSRRSPMVTRTRLKKARSRGPSGLSRVSVLCSL
jgi:hypothetical protein